VSIKEALKNIEKKFGKGAIMQLDGKPQDIEVIPSGSLSLDIALGVLGYPRGRIVEMFGPESSGKTTLALMATAEAQKMGLHCAFIDAEHALDPHYAGNLGVSMKNLWLAQPTTGEESLSIVEELVRSHEIGLIVVDSVAALTPKAELEGNIGDSHMGLMARLMSQSMRMLTAKIQKTGTTVIFLNQLRMKIGVFFGNPEVTTGGNALKFYASQRLDIRRKGIIKHKETPVGSNVKVRIVKNKVAPPYNIAEFDLYYDHGVDKIGELVDLGKGFGLIKGTSWLEFDNAGEKVRAQGKQAMAAAIVEHDLVDRLRDEIVQKVM
jgi:recombination protein RecA